MAKGACSASWVRPQPVRGQLSERGKECHPSEMRAGTMESPRCAAAGTVSGYWLTIRVQGEDVDEGVVAKGGRDLSIEERVVNVV